MVQGKPETVVSMSSADGREKIFNPEALLWIIMNLFCPRSFFIYVSNFNEIRCKKKPSFIPNTQLAFPFARFHFFEWQQDWQQMKNLDNKFIKFIFLYVHCCLWKSKTGEEDILWAFNSFPRKEFFASVPSRVKLKGGLTGKAPK
jgi:hypothetical protein